MRSSRVSRLPHHTERPRRPGRRRGPPPSRRAAGRRGGRFIGLLGSTGSYPYLTRAERRRALDAALEEAGGRVPILVGVGALRTDEAVRLTEDVRDAGAAVGLLAAVSVHAARRRRGVRACRRRGAGRPAALPLRQPVDHPFRLHAAVLDDRPARRRRGAEEPRPAPDAVAAHLDALRRATPDGFSVGCSVDWHAAEALLAGADAWYGVAAGLFPARCLAILRAARSGDAAEARRLDAAMRPLWDLFRAHSSLRVVYAAAEALGIAAPSRPDRCCPCPPGSGARWPGWSPRWHRPDLARPSSRHLASAPPHVDRDSGWDHATAAMPWAKPTRLRPACLAE